MRLLPCLLLLLPLLATAADVQWKWRDANGRLQYSDRPPPAGTPDKDILQRPAPPRAKLVQIVPAGQAASQPAPKPAAPAASTAKERAAELEKSKAEALKKAQQEADEAELRQQRAENCQLARARVVELDAGTRLYVTNARGEREVMDDARRAEERRRAQTAVSTSCSERK